MGQWSSRQGDVAGQSAEGGRRRRRGVLRGVLLVLTVAACVAVGGAYWLWRAEPVYWQERATFIASHSDDELMDIAESVEKRLLGALSEASDRHAPADDQPADKGDSGVGKRPAAGDRTPAVATGPGVGLTPPRTRTVSMTVNEINAWMDQRLAGWLANQGKHMPDGVEEPMLAIEGDRLVLAFRYVAKQFTQIVSLKFRIDLDAAGDATVRLEQVDAGRLPLPAQMVARGVRRRASKAAQDAETDAVTKLTAAFDGMMFDPVLDIDQQKVRFVAVTLHPGGVDLVVAGSDQPAPVRSALADHGG